MKTVNQITIEKFLGDRAHGETSLARRFVVEDFVNLVTDASLGDERAIGSLAVAFMASLQAEAASMLGPRGSCAGDVIEEFLKGLADQRWPYVAHRDGHPVEWMRLAVRCIARDHGRHRACWRARSRPAKQPEA
jgi:hypothetical protein